MSDHDELLQLFIIQHITRNTLVLMLRSAGEHRRLLDFLKALHCMAPGPRLRAAALAIAIAWPACSSASATHPRPTAPPASVLPLLPSGSTEIPIENIEGVVLVRATLTGPSGRDTTGALVVDTGAGFLGVDDELAHILGLTTARTKATVAYPRSMVLGRFDLVGRP